MKTACQNLKKKYPFSMDSLDGKKIRFAIVEEAFQHDYINDYGFFNENDPIDSLDSIFIISLGQNWLQDGLDLLNRKLGLQSELKLNDMEKIDFPVQFPNSN